MFKGEREGKFGVNTKCRKKLQKRKKHNEEESWGEEETFLVFLSCHCPLISLHLPHFFHGTNMESVSGYGNYCLL